jgi:hypothetical protein
MHRLVIAGLLLALTGCRSAYIEATIGNRTAQPLTLVELDYPSASFGTQNLAPGQDFHYRFKIIGQGDVTLLYTDAANAEHKATGPHLQEPDEGTLAVTVTPAGPEWSVKLKNR